MQMRNLAFRGLRLPRLGAMRSGGAVPFSIADFFASSEQGAWYGPSDLSTLFQDSAGTTPVTTAGQPVGRMLDKSGRANHAVQATAAARPTYQTGPARATLDKVDDRLLVTVPTGGFTGTMVLGTDQGTASYGVNIPAGPYDIGGRYGQYFPGTAIVGQVIRDGALSAGDAAATEAYFVEEGATASYGAVTDFSNFWRDWSELTSFPLIDTSSGTDFDYAWRGCYGLTSFPLIDTSAGTNFFQAWRGCYGLTSFPLIDTSSATNFYRAWFGCYGLTSFPLIDTSAGTNFFQAWRGCYGLTSFPLIDTSAVTNFSAAWFRCSSLTSFPLIDTSAGTNFRSAWYNCSSLTSFPLIDTSSGTDFRSAWYNCSSLTSFPLIDTSAGTTFRQAWFNCSSLTTIPAGLFDNIKGGDFNDAFANTALTQTSIDNILVSLVASGIAAGTRVFDQSGGSAPSATGEAAIDTLRSRGWTVTVTGGYSFSPADLFTGSETGVVYDVSDLSSMNTEPDQSGSVPAVGDVVRFIADKSGNGNHAQSPSLSASPVLRQDGNGNYYLEFAGAEDDALVTQSNINVSGNSAREYIGGSGPGGPVLTLNIEGDIGERWTVREDNGNVRVEIAGSAYVSGLSSDGVVGARLPDGGTLGDHVLSNGTTDQNASGSNIVNTGIGPLYIGQIAESTWGNAEFYGCTFIDKLLTAQQRSDARQYYAEKRGVVL